jgi:hypothetical protein
MDEHYVVTADHGRLRIYAETRTTDDGNPRLQLVESMDLPVASPRATAPASVGSDRSGWQVAVEASNRVVLARELDTFLQNRPHARWDFAAEPELHEAIVGQLSMATRSRLAKAFGETVETTRPEDVREYFAAGQH